MALEEAVSVVAGTTEDAVPTPVETPEPEVKETPAQPPQDPRDAERWARGYALEQGFLPPGQEKPQAKELIPGTDIPIPLKWDEFTPGEQLAYQSAIEAARYEFDNKIKATSSAADERLQRLELREARQNCIDGASSMLPEGARSYLKQAVSELEKANGGLIPGDHPVMRQMIADKAELMYVRAGRKPVGETVAANAQPKTGVPEHVKKEWLPLFSKTGYPGSGPGGQMTDKELEDELKKMDVTW